jgi:hypothetical protein
MENSMTATELLMGVADRMRQFGDGVDVLVVWNTREGQNHIKANCNYTRALGLAVYGAEECKDSLMKSPGGDIDDEGNAHPNDNGT